MQAFKLVLRKEKEKEKKSIKGRKSLRKEKGDPGRIEHACLDCSETAVRLSNH